mmetsp:Transcript_124165/g.359074  ORF Transcript_124165/g.359074 Transcript_124165/m.359074 type:complete len:226 (+) Transcript_124165:549-1226(+)
MRTVCLVAILECCGLGRLRSGDIPLRLRSPGLQVLASGSLPSFGLFQPQRTLTLHRLDALEGLVGGRRLLFGRHPHGGLRCCPRTLRPGLHRAQRVVSLPLRRCYFGLSGLNLQIRLLRLPIGGRLAQDVLSIVLHGLLVQHRGRPRALLVERSLRRSGPSLRLLLDVRQARFGGKFAGCELLSDLFDRRLRRLLPRGEASVGLGQLALRSSGRVLCSLRPACCR